MENKTGTEATLETQEARIRAMSKLDDRKKLVQELKHWRAVFVSGLPVSEIDRQRFWQGFLRGREILGIVGAYDLMEVIGGLELLIDNTSKLLEQDRA